MGEEEETEEKSSGNGLEKNLGDLMDLPGQVYTDMLSLPVRELEWRSCLALGLKYFSGDKEVELVNEVYLANEFYLQDFEYKEVDRVIAISQGGCQEISTARGGFSSYFSTCF